jgi:hypothetical protein
MHEKTPFSCEEHSQETYFPLSTSLDTRRFSVPSRKNQDWWMVSYCWCSEGKSTFLRMVRNFRTLLRWTIYFPSLVMIILIPIPLSKLLTISKRPNVMLAAQSWRFDCETLCFYSWEVSNLITRHLLIRNQASARWPCSLKADKKKNILQLLQDLYSIGISQSFLEKNRCRLFFHVPRFYTFSITQLDRRWDWFLRHILENLL